MLGKGNFAAGRLTLHHLQVLVFELRTIDRCGLDLAWTGDLGAVRVWRGGKTRPRHQRPLLRVLVRVELIRQAHRSPHLHARPID